MTSQQILQSDMIEILFEHRNKLYGAYVLRKNYSTELKKAIAITLLLVGALLFISGTSEKVQRHEQPKPVYDLTPVDLPPKERKQEVVKPKHAQATPQKVKHDVFFTNLKPVDNPPEPLPTQNALLTTTPGSEKVDGPSSAGSLPVPPLPPAGDGGGESKVVLEKADAPLPSRQPQFPGGTGAWLAFLGRHLRPPQDLDAGEKRMCLIRFAVDEAGTITNFQVVQSGGQEFDNEVIRVLRKMPKWLPAVQNGKPIAVSFTQPVTFAAAEE